MAVKTKYYFVDQVRLKIAAGDIAYDERTHPKLIMLTMDQVLNWLGEQNFSDYYVKYGRMDVSDHFIATFDNIPIIEGTNFSECTLPATYADLPKNQGIYEVIPTKRPTERIIIRSSRDLRRNKNLMEGTLENKVFAYPRGNKLIFSKSGLIDLYKTLTIRLVIVDASVIADDARYPVPPNKEKDFVQMVYEQFIYGNIIEDNINDDFKMR